MSLRSSITGATFLVALAVAGTWWSVRSHLESRAPRPASPTPAAIETTAANLAPAPRVTQTRCSGPNASVKITAERAATEAALARAIVVLRGGDLDHLVVESVSVPRPPHAGDPTLDGLPSDVRHALAAGESTCFEMSPSRLPPAAQLVPFAELRGAVTTGRADWPPFQARFPDARMWFAFSPAVLSGDGRHAVVFYERTCPGRCGEAEWVWFTRTGAKQPWRVAKEWWNWIS